ncbi:D-lyxose/D-mannose family sugar isomerase [Shinella sp.]|uniref:D-lyxose/D-mannose family sugar isomerase n=1 Tax=Shinella sp. TaxID=1870904 RepID=UPI00258D2947|nr:D-lyxose/D-mannose family sugar isomerase [Shinella sp.]MCW5706884.1 D-lyxose/D-mannose family sugar isomerase [Shinella sp.]
MKRSEINKAIAQAEEDFRAVGFRLPVFGSWDLNKWKEQGASASELAATGHGWDVTDFAEGQFAKRGLLLFTVRNGRPEGGNANRPYAEKIMISRQDQLTPMHRHAAKVEDIINRGSLKSGARLAVKLFNSHADGSLDRNAKVTAHLDGMTREIDPGTVIFLEAGESITLFPGAFHAFWGDGGDVVVGEVSSVNDDNNDNFFAEPLARFTSIEEDEAIYRPLVTDIAAIFK